MISPNALLDCAQAQAHKSEDIMEPSTFMQDPLSIHLIADEILKHLPPAKILQCSLVSRYWRDTCRQYLRHLKVYVVVTNPACSSLQALDELLVDSVSVPFVGLSFEDSTSAISENNHCLRCKRYRNKSVDNIYPFIFSKLELKVLKINYVNRRTCIADKFLKSILIKRAAGIEEMIISGWSDSVPSLWKYVNIPATSVSALFPSLKVCRLNRMPEISLTKSVLIREIVLSAPNLSYLDVIVPVSMFSEDENSPQPQFPKNNYHVIKAFHCLDTNSVVRLAREKPRLEYLSLCPSLIEQDEEVVDKGREGVATVCESSIDSLKALECRYNMIMLKFLPSKSYASLTSLDLTFSVKNFEYYRVNYLLLRSIDLRPIFPSLREVTWRLDEKYGAGYFRDYEMLLDELQSIDVIMHIWKTPYACRSVTKILLVFQKKCYLYGSDPLMWTDIGRIFPNVRKFYVKEDKNFWIFWRDVSLVYNWEETLETVGYYYNIPVKDFPHALSYIFCGIEPEELSEIFNLMDEKALKGWQFAPTRDAPISKFLRLPKVELLFEHKKDEVCGDECVPYPQDLERMLGLTMRWIRAKMPELVLQTVVVNPCNKKCDPFRLNYRRNYVQGTKCWNVTTSGRRLCWTFEMCTEKNV